ncbi:MAG: hypothetical protein HC804_06005 [Anaerolineae bacterium]|nr:hypothetical protein [Anaerolineae bacterium]
MIALTKIETVDPQSNMKAWLSTIAVNKCRDILRICRRANLQNIKKFKEKIMKRLAFFLEIRKRYNCLLRKG